MIGSINSLKIKADNFFQQGNLHEGILQLEEAAELGCLESSFRLATIYFNESKPEKGFKHLIHLDENEIGVGSVFKAFYDWLINKETEGFTNTIKQYKAEVPFAQLVSSLIEKDADYSFKTLESKKLNEEPNIDLIFNVGPDLLGQLLINMLGNNLQPSKVYQPGEEVSNFNSVRDNYAINFSQVQPYIPFAIIKYYFSKIANMPMNHSEPPMLMRYQKGQKFKPHHDFIDLDIINSNHYEKKLGQRVKTLLFYINDNFTNGETYFNELDLMIKPVKNSVLLFDNVSKSGDLLQKSLHEGRPVTDGEKWLLSIWYRENPED
ncbi:2OG-Fe(II) oxygenase [Kangiella sp. HZ709]|uniref:prolyl hydroxylase family protein n=1 Tax=Kangiella sp. HZ709 TaxID=2666328 RepID=UPI0012B07838|nr:2OG-Fe(II) oxygenase [Kangiella sp. HZ709]MRX26981.1 hypothetical protein [Kangiella sp. HZ709]